MAEMTKDMYGAIGRVGDKVFYQRGGKTIARTITKPKNPKTEAQSLKRVLLKAVNKSYSMLKEICDHSFEDHKSRFDCMNKFKRVNLKYLHEHVTTLQESSQGLDSFYQFTPLQSEKWTPFAAIISEGHLPVVSVGIDGDGNYQAYVNSPGRTYNDFVTAWGLQRGDLLLDVVLLGADRIPLLLELVDLRLGHRVGAVADDDRDEADHHQRGQNNADQSCHSF